MLPLVYLDPKVIAYSAAVAYVLIWPCQSYREISIGPRIDVIDAAPVLSDDNRLAIIVRINKRLDAACPSGAEVQGRVYTCIGYPETDAGVVVAGRVEKISASASRHVPGVRRCVLDCVVGAAAERRICKPDSHCPAHGIGVREKLGT